MVDVQFEQSKMPAIYQALTTTFNPSGVETTLPALPVQYADYDKIREYAQMELGVTT